MNCLKCGRDHRNDPPGSCLHKSINGDRLSDGSPHQGQMTYPWGGKIVLCVGLPRSGKTTWARQQGCPIVNPDSIRLALHGQRFYAPAEPWVWAQAYTMAEALLRAGNDKIIVDATNVTAKRRGEWETRFRGKAEIAYNIITTSPAECIRRAEREHDDDIIPVIKKMAAEWDLPRPWSPNEEVV